MYTPCLQRRHGVAAEQPKAEPKISPDPHPNGWRDMDTCPRDGTDVLALYDNNASYELVVVGWVAGDLEYPWHSRDNSFPEWRIAYWQPAPPLLVATNTEGTPI